MTYNGKESKLKVKICKVSNRILSVDNNYELIGYNFPLNVSTFIMLLEKNNVSYRRFNFFPNFKLGDLKSDPEYSEKPKFMQRKLLAIYKYLIQNPVHKYITPNVSIVNGKYIKYQISDVNSKLFIDTCDKLIDEFNDIDSYYNDDEDDKDYIEYYSYYKDLEKLNYKLRLDYRNKLIKNKLDEFNKTRQINPVLKKLNNNSLKEKIIRQHDIIPFKYENNGILYKCTICKQTCFVE